jgi:hypothetical protein
MELFRIFFRMHAHVPGVADGEVSLAPAGDVITFSRASCAESIDLWVRALRTLCAILFQRCSSLAFTISTE